MCFLSFISFKMWR